MNGMPRLLFDYPLLLPLALLFPLVVFWLRFRRRRDRHARLHRFAGESALARLLGRTGESGRSRTAMLMLVAALCGAAMAGPRWGVANDQVTARGIDIALAIDASLSMLAEDERPSRLERVKQEIRRLRAMSRADRVALIAFAGRSYILTPLTGDDGALELFLENLDPSVVGQGGSALAPAIRQGMELLLASSGGADRALVVFSDGEAFDSRDAILAAATEAGRNGISLVTVGFGTERGATIPIRDGSVVRPKRDEDGNIVTTVYSGELLEAAAKAAGGTFIPSEASDKASRIRASLRSLHAVRRAMDVREDHTPRFLWFLVPALILLIYDSARGERNRTFRAQLPPAAGNKGAAIAVLLVLLASGCAKEPDPAVLFSGGDVEGALGALRAKVAAGDSSATELYNLGSALLGSDSLVAAAQLLDQVRKDSEGEVRMRARYNAGLSFLRLGRIAGAAESGEAMQAAREAYRALLEERPGDMEAKWNYELALRNPPHTGGGGGGDNDPDDEEMDDGGQQGALDLQQAEALLNSAAREERDVQKRKQRPGRTATQGKDW